LLDTGRPYAESAWARVAENLDQYAASWAGMHEHACMAHQRGEHSDRLMDRRMACLERRRDAMDSAITVLEETNSQSLQHVVEVVHNLPSIAYCGRVEALAAEVPPPEDTEVAAQVEALRQRLSRADALEHAGRYQDAIEVARAVAESAEPVGYGPLRAEAALTHGRIALHMRAFDDAIELLDRATRHGLAASMDEVAVEAMARRIYAAGMNPTPSADTAAYLVLGEALSQRIPDSAFVHALLLNNAGAVFMARGERDVARQHFERALEVKNSATESLPIELANILRNLAMVSADEERRAALLQQALNEFERAVGRVHPMTLSLRTAAGFYRSSPARARDILEPACTAYRRYHPELVNEVGECLFYLGFITAELGHRDRASEYFAAVDELLQPHAEQPEYRSLHRLARGHALLYRGEHAVARASFRAALEDSLIDSEQAWWIQRRAAQAWLGLGASSLALGRRRDAIDALERALPVFEHLVTINQNAAQARYLAWNRAILAMALWPAQTSSDLAERARALMAQAVAWYRDAGEGYEHRLAELDAWRRDHGMSP
jgi:tetratricopeptide (TPR) repeat protein